MDVASIRIANASLSAAINIGRALLDLRDWNQVAEKVTKLNDSLLDAQQRLFSITADLLALQQEHLQAAEELRKAREAIAERGRYSLVEVSDGQWAYRVDVGPHESGTGKPGGAQSPHYVCQQCFDAGRKVVMQRADFYGHAQIRCPVCNTTLSFSPRG